MTTHELIEQLEGSAADLNSGVYHEFAKDMHLAAIALRKYVTAMDAIYSHNEAARAAVIQHFGIHHAITLK
jgi:hypothetical protein